MSVCKRRLHQLQNLSADMVEIFSNHMFRLNYSCLLLVALSQPEFSHNQNLSVVQKPQGHQEEMVRWPRLEMFQTAVHLTAQTVPLTVLNSDCP